MKPKPTLLFDEHKLEGGRFWFAKTGTEADSDYLDRSDLERSLSQN